jgi:hypothetical protein
MKRGETSPGVVAGYSTNRLMLMADIKIVEN